MYPKSKFTRWMAAGLVVLGLAVLWWRPGVPAGATRPDERPIRSPFATDAFLGSEPGPPAPGASVPAPRVAASEIDAGSVVGARPDPSWDVDSVRRWARRDPDVALLWIPQAPPGEMRTAVVEVACAEVVQFDPGQAVALAERYAEGNLPLFEHLLQQWAERDDLAALGYAEGWPEGEMRQRLISQVALARARHDPAEAARLVIREIPAGAILDEAVVGIVQRWTQQEPAAALGWVRSFPAGPLRERAGREVQADRNRSVLTDRDRLIPRP